MLLISDHEIQIKLGFQIVHGIEKWLNGSLIDSQFPEWL